MLPAWLMGQYYDLDKLSICSTSVLLSTVRQLRHATPSGTPVLGGGFRAVNALKSHAE